MIGLRIGAAELAEIEAGAPALVLAPGAELPDCPPLVVLALSNGVLARPGTTPARLLPLPAGTRLLAVLAKDQAAAARLLPLLPPGLRVLAGPDATAALAGLLAALARDAAAARLAAEAERDLLRRTLAEQPPAPRLALELPPLSGATATGALRQPLGRAAEGICTVEIHLAALRLGAPAAEAPALPTRLRIRLLAGTVLRGAWTLPAAALAEGWLALDLPEPIPPGPEEAILEIAPETAPGEILLLAAAEPGDGAPLAIRLWTAGPGRHLVPQHCDWAALGAPAPGVAHAVPEAAWAEAAVAGATPTLVATGEDAPRLILDIAPGAEARVALPALPTGALDLLRATLALRGAGRAEAMLEARGAGGRIASAWRSLDGAAPLSLALPLPAGPMVELVLVLRAGTAALVEVTRLVLMAGAAGEPRRAPAAAPARAVAAIGARAVAPPAAPAWSGFRTAPPQPKLGTAGPGIAEAAPLPAPAAAPMAAVPGGTGFREIKLHQHMAGADGGYRHLDVTLSGLVAPAGLWRQVRVKLFDRRGTVGLEFREMTGWPQMFDVWPAGRSDSFGPFWRLETEAPAEALAQLSTPHDRALIAALMEVLVELAGAGAAAAGLPPAEAEAWRRRAARLAEAVAETRPGPRGGPAGPPG